MGWSFCIGAARVRTSTIFLGGKILPVAIQRSHKNLIMTNIEKYFQGIGVPYIVSITIFEDYLKARYFTTLKELTAVKVIVVIFSCWIIRSDVPNFGDDFTLGI